MNATEQESGSYPGVRSSLGALFGIQVRPQLMAWYAGHILDLDHVFSRHSLPLAHRLFGDPACLGDHFQQFDLADGASERCISANFS